MTRGTEELAPSPVGLGAGSSVPRVRNLLLSTTTDMARPHCGHAFLCSSLLSMNNLSSSNVEVMSKPK